MLRRSSNRGVLKNATSPILPSVAEHALKYALIDDSSAPRISALDICGNLRVVRCQPNGSGNLIITVANDYPFTMPPAKSQTPAVATIIEETTPDALRGPLYDVTTAKASSELMMATYDNSLIRVPSGVVELSQSEELGSILSA
ncbi:unnamed protein product [Protopolystoma xenopodis]|uniref:Uncharacterized protein n=1 Tax=Protopolystoma xenopodis TaxID=117903 RepID=A0A3S5AC26_9PLAT|nr:unnamed protein product [Protopolystoma xenopodis]